jgi:hypothetical protein
VPKWWQNSPINGIDLDHLIPGAIACWRSGKTSQNNGILFLIAKQNRRVEIETGQGIGQRFPDAEAKELIDSQHLGCFLLSIPLLLQ